jgi:hypothetical protein
MEVVACAVGAAATGLPRIPVAKKRRVGGILIRNCAAAAAYSKSGSNQGKLMVQRASRDR